MRETSKWLICPVEEFIKGKPQLDWEVVSVSPTAQNLVQEIENKLREEEWVIFEWSPIHLRHLLQQWYFKEGVKEVSALKVWQDCCHYLYLPRLVKDVVFKHAIEMGLQSQDFFGFASGKEGEKYLSFVFGDKTCIILDESSLLIERDAAAVYKNSIEPAVVESPPQPDSDTERPPTSFPPEEEAPATPNPDRKQKRQFYGTIDLDPVKAKMDFAMIVDEVVQQFTSKLGVDVTISVEIQAKSKEGFDEVMQRTIKENCNVLKFNNAEFEDGE